MQTDWIFLHLRNILLSTLYMSSSLGDMPTVSMGRVSCSPALKYVFLSDLGFRTNEGFFGVFHEVAGFLFNSMLLLLFLYHRIEVQKPV